MANPTPPSTLTTTLITDLQTRHHLPVSQTWLTTLLQNTRQPLPPIPALTSTIHFRLLNSDFTQSLSTDQTNTHFLPVNIAEVQIKERHLSGPAPIPVQVLDVDDIGTSKWSQFEAIERIERGEEVRGREVIRTLPSTVEGSEGSSMNSSSAGGSGRSHGPHKFLLQDARGTKVTAFETVRIARLGIGDDGMAIGMKVLLKPGTVVRRGMLMLAPEKVTVLGGKVEVWDKAWREGRKGKLVGDLQQAAGEEGQDRGD